MNAIQQARRAYAPTSAPLMTARSAEYRAFSEITARLNAHRPPSTRTFADLVAALHDNRALWTILASDVADPANLLPAPLRASIFYLSEFTELHTSRILAGGGDVTALIDINMAVLRGLSGTVATGEAS